MLYAIFLLFLGFYWTFLFLFTLGVPFLFLLLPCFLSIYVFTFSLCSIFLHNTVLLFSILCSIVFLSVHFHFASFDTLLFAVIICPFLYHCLSLGMYVSLFLFHSLLFCKPDSCILLLSFDSFRSFSCIQTKLSFL